MSKKIKIGTMVAYITKRASGLEVTGATVEKILQDGDKLSIKRLNYDAPIIVSAEIVTPVKTVWDDTLKIVNDTKEEKKTKLNKRTKKVLRKLNKSKIAFVEFEKDEEKLFREMLPELHKRKYLMAKLHPNIREIELGEKSKPVFTSGRYIVVKDTDLAYEKVS